MCFALVVDIAFREGCFCVSLFFGFCCFGVSIGNRKFNEEKKLSLFTLCVWEANRDGESERERVCVWESFVCFHTYFLLTTVTKAHRVTSRHKQTKQNQIKPNRPERNRTEPHTNRNLLSCVGLFYDCSVTFYYLLFLFIDNVIFSKFLFIYFLSLSINCSFFSTFFFWVKVKKKSYCCFIIISWFNTFIHI